VAEPLDVIAARFAQVALREAPNVGRLGPGPVLTVVREPGGKIYIGLNTGIPQKLSDVMYKAILAQKARIWQGEVVVVRTDPQAVGGHAEVNALNPAIRDREKVLGRKLTEKDLGVFELHNLWLTGDRAMTTAPRCEHCARITRGVSVTQSVFVAEGGVVGEIDVLQRGLVIAGGSRAGKPTTTTNGEVDVPARGSATPAGSRAARPMTTTVGEFSVPERGSVTPAGSRTSRSVTTTSGWIGAPGGGEEVGSMIDGLLTAALVLATPLIKQWFADNYLQEKWTAEEQAMVMKAIEGSVPRYNILILSRRADIQREKAAGRPVKLRIDVDTQWVDTDFGPAQTHATVSHFTLLFADDVEVEWPLFQKSYGFWSQLLNAARITCRRNAYYIPL
jgi:hypothetical protein